MEITFDREAAIDAPTLASLLAEAGRSDTDLTITERFQTGASRFVRFRAGGKHYLMKLPRDIGNPTELVFYDRIAPRMPSAVSPPFVLGRCTSQESFLVLEDLGDTHERTDLDIPPTRRQAIAMVECLAKLHACWHDAPDLPEIATGFELARFAERISAIEAYLPEFMARMDDRLEQTDRAIIGDVIAQLPCRIHARMQERPLTLIHGDAHAWNFLVPNAGAAAAAMLVDWHYGSDEFRIGFGMWDVAYLMVHWWFPKRRRQLQPMLLAQYQQVMRDHGVTCRPGRLMEDLRLAASYCLLRPIVESRTGPPWSWYPQLEYALEAVRELAATA